jgi:hypothetical protein
LAIFNISGNTAITVFGAIGVAVFTAWLTAHTTNRRLDKQLDHDRVMLDKQLAHDRVMDDRRELRDAFDDAVAAGLHAMRRVSGLVVGIEKAEEHGAASLTPLRQHAQDHMRAKMNEFDLAMADLIPHIGRLQLRLGSQHEVVKRLGNLPNEANDAMKGLPSRLPVSAADVQAARDFQRDFVAEVQEWIDDAYELVRALHLSADVSELAAAE